MNILSFLTTVKKYIRAFQIPKLPPTRVGLFSVSSDLSVAIRTNHNSVDDVTTQI